MDPLFAGLRVVRQCLSPRREFLAERPSASKHEHHFRAGSCSPFNQKNTATPSSAASWRNRVAARVPDAGERLVEDGDPRQPLHVRHPLAARHDELEREFVLRWQRRAVEVSRHQNVFA
jgi:hypothetical protein